jgi:deoxyadenosine/deoxycytidine kinase
MNGKIVNNVEFVGVPTQKYEDELKYKIDKLLTPDVLKKYWEAKGKITLLSIEGGIGAGKSTLIQNIRDANLDYEFVATDDSDECFTELGRIEVLPEPSDRWQHELAFGTHLSMLQAYYRDPRNNGGVFQLYALITRAIRLVNTIINTKKRIVIVERSIYSDMNCFMRVNRESGNVNGCCITTYFIYFRMIESLLDREPDGYIYLCLDPVKCSARIEERARDAESDIPLEYLQSLEIAHNEWISTMKNKVLKIDASKNFKDDAQEFGTVMTQINRFIETLQSKSN